MPALFWKQHWMPRQSHSFNDISGTQKSGTYPQNVPGIRISNALFTLIPTVNVVCQFLITLISQKPGNNYSNALTCSRLCLHSPGSVIIVPSDSLNRFVHQYSRHVLHAESQKPHNQPIDQIHIIEQYFLFPSFGQTQTWPIQFSSKRESFGPDLR